MEYTAVCRICGEKVNFKEGNVCNLGEHLVKKHPELEIINFTLEDTELSRNKSQSKLSNKSSSIRKFSKKNGPKTNKKKNLYKTTVETWHPGSSPLTCPKCGNCEQPYIRKQRNKVARHSLGAFFLLGCWPLCFLPMVMCGSSTTLICCRKCGYCFGTYDKKKGQLIPATKDIQINIPTIC